MRQDDDVPGPPSPDGPPHRGAGRPAPTPPAPSGRAATADLVVTVVLIVAGPLACIAASGWGLFSVMATDNCGAECGSSVELAILLMIVSPWVLWLVFGVWAVVRLFRKRPAVWVVVAGVAVGGATFVAANVVLIAAA